MQAWIAEAQATGNFDICGASGLSLHILCFWHFNTNCQHQEFVYWNLNDSLILISTPHSILMEKDQKQSIPIK